MSTAAMEDESRKCSDCRKRFSDAENFYCQTCVNDAVTCAEAEAAADKEAEMETPAEGLREWAKRRHILGQITREVFVALEQCADDMEAHHG